MEVHLARLKCSECAWSCYTVGELEAHYGLLHPGTTISDYMLANDKQIYVGIRYWDSLAEVERSLLHPALRKSSP